MKTLLSSKNAAWAILAVLLLALLFLSACAPSQESESEADAEEETEVIPEEEQPQGSEEEEPAEQELTGYEKVISDAEEMKLVSNEADDTAGKTVDDFTAKMRLGALLDIDGDGSEELLLHFPVYEQGMPTIYCQLWTMEEGSPRLVAEKQLYALVGSSGYGGFATVETDEGPRLCIWYEKGHGVDPAYRWTKEEYLLFDCEDLSLTDAYCFDYAHNGTDETPEIYHGSEDFDYELLHDGEAIAEEEFLTVRNSLYGNLEYIVGFPPDAYADITNVISLGQSFSELLDSLAVQ